MEFHTAIQNHHYFVDFKSIQNIFFKKYFKKYMKTRLLGGKRFSWGTALNYLRSVPKFLNFISELEPEWNDLNGSYQNAY